jgi:hypothetical protein
VQHSVLCMWVLSGVEGQVQFEECWVCKPGEFVSGDLHAVLGSSDACLLAS